jgi:hypothetical protein
LQSPLLLLSLPLLLPEVCPQQVQLSPAQADVEAGSGQADFKYSACQSACTAPMHTF